MAECEHFIKIYPTFAEVQLKIPIFAVDKTAEFRKKIEWTNLQPECLDFELPSGFYMMLESGKRAT